MKYPRIAHLFFSHPFKEDIIMNGEFRNRRWIITEKVDGSQLSIEFNGNLIMIYNRNTVLLTGKMDRQFHILPSWLSKYIVNLDELLNDRYILFGDWMFHKHTVYYDKLPDWLICYGLFDKQNNCFIEFYTAKNRIEKMGISFVPVLYDGIIDSEIQILDLIKTSTYSTNEDMEGVVLHSIDDTEKCKYVTEKFKGTVDNTRHWRVCKRIQNKIGVVG